MLRRRRAVRGPGLQSLLGGLPGDHRAGRAPGHDLRRGRGRQHLDRPGRGRPGPRAQRRRRRTRRPARDAAARRGRAAGQRPAGHRARRPRRAGRPARPAAPPPHSWPRATCCSPSTSRRASAAVAARGGTDAAVAQILRRCALRAEEVLSANGLTVRRLDEAGGGRAVREPVRPVLGRAPDGALPPTVETLARHPRRPAPGRSSFAVTRRRAPTSPTGCSRSRAPRRRRSRSPRWCCGARPRVALGDAATLLLRVSGPGPGPRPLDRHRAGRPGARDCGLTLQRLDGEQGALLRATTPVGVGAAHDARRSRPIAPVAPGHAGRGAALGAAPRRGRERPGDAAAVPADRHPRRRRVRARAGAAARGCARRPAGSRCASSPPGRGVWQPLLARGADAPPSRSGSALPPPTGPSLVVDDRPGRGAPARRRRSPWRCRIDIRTPASGGDLRTLIGADVLLVGGLLPDLALAATSGMGVSVPHLSQLTAPAAGTVTVLRRGGVDYVTLDPTRRRGAAAAQAGLTAAALTARLSRRRAGSRRRRP